MRQNETVVDSRVVELTLDNHSFESNATQSISTISKLKKALDFSDAGKSLDDISRASKNIKLDTLSNGLQAASAGFSALEAVAFGALANIGSKISDTAMKIGKMFTIDPVTDGFGEYQLKMDSVQTIMASTGESLESVNEYLEELNLYADKTIYSFSDMTNSIGKFTNAGVSLEDAVAAIQGISNEAAVSGANAQQASHAMYNFAQALSSGFVKLIDWKSIENANMATVEFKNMLLETAVEVGTVSKATDGMYTVLTKNAAGKAMKETIDATHNFNDSLQHQWMTTDVLTKTLAKYADETSTIGKKAFAAATEVKTFSQLVDTLKEAAGSGWAQTWEILVGDFNQAKELFTFLSNRFGKVIDGFSKSRNDLLKAAMGAPDKYVTAEDWASLDLTKSKATSLANALIEVGKSRGIKFVSEDVDGLIDSLSEGWVTAVELQDALNMNPSGYDKTEEELESIRQAALRVIRGDYGNDMAERFRLLEEEGFDAQQVQDYVNALKAAAGGTWNITEEVKKEADAVVFSTDALAAKTDEELKALGWSEKRIKNLRKLQKEAEKTGTPLNELMQKLEEPEKSGRENLFEAIKNAFAGIQRIVLMVKGAWKSVFPPASADGLRSMTEKINSLSQSFKKFAINNGMKIYKFFRGLFSVLAIGIDIVKTLALGAFSLLGKAIGFLAPIIGNVLVKIAEMATSFRNWLIENQIIENAIAAIGAVMDVVGEKIQWFVDKIGSVFDFGGRVVGLFLRQMDRLGGFSFKNVVDSFKFVKKAVFDYLERKFPAFGKFRDGIRNFTDKIKEGFKGLGITLGSPFEKFFDILEFGRKVVGLFTRHMERLGGFSFENLIKSFNFVKRAVLDYLSNKFPGFAKFREGFNNLAESIKGTVTGLFTDISGLFGSIFGSSDVPLKDSLGKMQTDLTNWFKSLPEKFGAFKDSVFTFFSGVWTNISTSLSNAWPAIKEGFVNLWTNIKDWFKNNGGIDLSFMETIFKGLRIAVLIVAGVIGVALGGVVLAIVGVVAAVRTGWKAISGFFKSITQNEAIKSGAGKIRAKFSGAFEKIGKVVQKAREVFDLFMKKLKSLGGFSFANVVESFNFVKEKVFKYFEGKFPGFAKFREGFNKFTENLKEGLANLGLDSDGLKSKWHRLTVFTGDAFTSIYKGAKDAGSKAVKAVNNFLSNTTVRKNLSNFKSGFVTLWNSIGPAFSGIKDSFKDFLARVEELGGFKFENFGKIWDVFKETIGASFKDFTGFDGIKTAVTTAWEDIKKYISDHGFDIDGIQAKFTEFTEGLKKVFEEDLKLPEIWDSFVGIFARKTEEGGDKIETESDSLLERIGKFFNTLKEMFTGENGLNIPKAVTDFLTLITNLFSSESGKTGGVIKTEADQIITRISDFKQEVGAQLNDLGINEGSIAFMGTLSDLFVEGATEVNSDVSDSSNTITSSILEFVTKLKESVTGLSIPEGLTEFISSFQHTQEAFSNIGKTEEEGGTTVKDIIIGFIEDIKDILGKIPVIKLSLLYGLVSFTTGAAGLGMGINRFSKGFKDDNAAKKFKAMAVAIGAIGGVVGAVMLYAQFGNMERLKTTCNTLAVFLGEVAGIFTVADVLIEKVGTGLGGGEKTKLTSGAQLVNNIFDKLFSEAGLIGIVLSAGHALSELASTENFNGDAVLKGAEGIAMIVGVVMGMDWLSDIFDKLPGKAPDKSVLDVVSNVLETLGSGLLIEAAMKAIRGLMEIPDFDGEKAKAAGEAIATVVGVATGISGALGLLGKFGIDGAAALKGLEALGVVMIGSGAVMGVLGLVGRLEDMITGKEPGTSSQAFIDFVNEGGDQLVAIATKLGEVVGGIIGGLAGAVIGGFSQGLTTFGESTAQNVVAFIEAIKPLGDEEHQVDKEAIVGGLTLLVETIGELTAAGLGVAVKDFFTSMLTDVMSAGDKPKTSLEVFSEAVDDVTEIVNKWNAAFPKDKSIRFDKEGFDALVQSVEEIPDGGLGGFLGRLFGVESATGEFAGDMGKLGEGIRAFADAAGDVSISAGLLGAVRMIGDLAAASAAVGNEAVYYSPFIDFLTGNGTEVSVATALNQFAQELKLDSDDYNRMSKVARAAANIGTFAATVAGATFKGSDIADATLVSTFCGNIRAIVDAVTYSASGDYTMVDKLAESITTIANTNLNEAADAFANKEASGLDKYLEAADAVKKNAETVTVGATLDTTQAEKDSEKANSTFATIATNMVAALASTFSSDESKASIDASLKTLIDSAVTSISSQVGDFGLAATNLVAGFTNTLGAFHIRLAVSAAAYSIGRVAVTSLQKALDERSPSHESERIAEFFVKGFTIGVDNHVDDVYRGSHGLGQAAVRGLRTSVRAINAMIDSGLDAQPVIRPVLDLTNIQNGSLALNGMLGGGVPIGVAGNLNAINANVNARTITTNSDILSALTDLGSALSRRPAQTNQYTINGITYDDGTNVSEAVRSLIHAARIERRV